MKVKDWLDQIDKAEKKLLEFQQKLSAIAHQIPPNKEQIMNKSKYKCNECSLKCTLSIHTWFVNVSLNCPKGRDIFKWIDITEDPPDKEQI